MVLGRKCSWDIKNVLHSTWQGRCVLILGGIYLSSVWLITHLICFDLKQSTIICNVMCGVQFGLSILASKPCSVNYRMFYGILKFSITDLVHQVWFLWNFIQDSKVFIQGNALENVICPKVAILSRLQCVNIVDCKLKMPEDLIGGWSTLVQVMAWCHQAASHYLNQLLLTRSLLPYGITGP